jgi:ribonucleoside-diphosphate reductase beta chain
MLLFNPQGNDNVDQRQIWEGSTTNLMNLNNVKYTWALKLYLQMRENFWVPDKVDMTSDINTYSLLTEDEARAYQGTLSYLIFLDSLQTCNLSYFKHSITAPEIRLCLAEQESQEALHSASYQVVIETNVPSEDRNALYDFWRSDRQLFNRCEYITALYQESIDDPLNKEKYFISLYADYLLESIYFYMGFNLFHALAARHLMGSTNDMITYIKRDEYTHVILYQNLVKEAMKIFPYSQDQLHELMHTVIVQERNWMSHITGDQVLGINSKATTDYLNYLGNLRLKAIGLEPTLPEVKKNPYSMYDRSNETSSDANTKTNFFEGTVTSYNVSSAVPGWDLI